MALNLKPSLPPARANVPRVNNLDACVTGKVRLVEGQNMRDIMHAQVIGIIFFRRPEKNIRIDEVAWRGRHQSWSWQKLSRAKAVSGKRGILLELAAVDSKNSASSSLRTRRRRPDPLSSG